MDGKIYEINRKAHSLRSSLFMEHFHMSEIEAEDPLSDETIRVMRKTAEVILSLFRQTLYSIGIFLGAFLMITLTSWPTCVNSRKCPASS